MKVILSHQTPKSNMSQQESPIIKNQFVGILQTNEPHGIGNDDDDEYDEKLASAPIRTP